MAKRSKLSKPTVSAPWPDAPSTVSPRAAEIEAELAAIGDPDAVIRQVVNELADAKRKQREDTDRNQREVWRLEDRKRAADRKAGQDRARIRVLREELDALKEAV